MNDPTETIKSSLKRLLQAARDESRLSPILSLLTHNPSTFLPDPSRRILAQLILEEPDAYPADVQAAAEALIAHLDQLAVEAAATPPQRPRDWTDHYYELPL